MERLWAPWRMKYITGQVESSEDGKCVFCDAVATQDDAEPLVLGRAEHTFTIMNLFPYTNGHLMVVPNRHVAKLQDLTVDEHAEIMSGASAAVDVLGSLMNSDGFNLGMNLGRAAGAGIDTHLHMHVVPRWNGDTNFMLVFDDVRVISESLDETYAKVRAEYERRGLTG